MYNAELLGRAAQAATCQVLSSAGYSLVGAGAVSLWAGGTGLVPITTGGISLLAANYLCPDMEMGGNTTNDYVEGCRKVDGVGTLEVKFGGEWITAFPPGNLQYSNGQQAVEITNVEIVKYDDGNKYRSFITWSTPNGATSDNQYYLDTEEKAKEIVWRITPTNGTCVEQGDEVQPIPPEAYEPIEYTDNITNCNYTVQLQGFAQIQEGGDIQPVYLVEGATQQRADGGRMGGCNFPPTIYVPPGGGDGGGGTYLPVPDDGPPPGPGGDIPWWAGPLAAAVGGAVLNQILDSINDLLAPSVEEASFTLTAPCNKDEAGNPLQREWTFPAQREPARLLSHQVALMEIMQQHLDWKTPICDETTIPEGDFRTISFRSDETSPYGKSRLRKRFRYRAVSGNDLSDVVDHWKDFSWEGGPYRVRWIGESWRSPEIWAASEAEGQRVIQHAAAEAGVSPLEGGRWSTRLSSSGRQGVPGTMRVDTTKGFYWITARDGSSQRPIVAVISPE